MNKVLILCLLALPLWFVSCSNNGDGGNLKPANGNIYRDVNLQKIYDCRFTGNSAELIRFISSDLPEYRKAAVYSIGALRDSMVLINVISLLNDADNGVRLAAVEAIGQIGHRSGSTPLKTIIESDNADDIKKAAIVALGKCGTENELNYICNLNYIKSYPQLATAQAEALCMFLKRGVKTSTAVDKVVTILVDKNADEHLQGIAAQYLSECNTDLTPYTDLIISAYKKTQLVCAKMYLARALRFAKNERSQYFLQRIITQDTCDYRVRVSAIESCNSFKYTDFKAEMLNLVCNNDGRIASCAANFILNKGTKADSTIYENTIEHIPNWKSRAIMRAAVLKYSNNKQMLASNIITGIEASQNVYEKIALMEALSTHIDSYNYIRYEAFNSNNILIRTAGLKTLINMFQQPEFAIYSRTKKRNEDINMYKEFAIILKNAIQKGTPEMAAMAAKVIAENVDNLSVYYSNTYFFNQALHNCKLPNDAKAYSQIAEANRVVNGQDTRLEKTKVSATPDWNYITSIKPNQKIRLNTNKGQVVIQLKVNTAPVGVEHFMRLVESGYFNNTTLLRLSPFLVADNGNYSEFEQLKEEMIPYEPNYNAVTEGNIVLFGYDGDNVYANKFATLLAPCVGFNSNSTVFASVIEGIDYLHNIQDGDMIISIEKL